MGVEWVVEEEKVCLLLEEMREGLVLLNMEVLILISILNWQWCCVLVWKRRG